MDQFSYQAIDVVAKIKQNIASYRDMMAYSASDISKSTLVGIIFLSTLFGNALIAYVLIKCRRDVLRNRPTYQFILNIVLSDLAVGLLTMPFEFVRELLDEWIFGTVACKMVEFVLIAIAGTAVITHALIAYDRYRSLARPYLPKMEAMLVNKMIALSWLVPAFVSSPYLYMLKVEDIDSKIICTPKAFPIGWLDKVYEAVEFVSILFAPFLVMCWCYFHVTLIMWGKSPLVAVENSSAASENSVVRRNKKRVTRTSGLVAAAFTVCWLPTFVLSFVRIISGREHVHRTHLLHEIAMFGTFINEAINPIIYCAFDRNIKARIRLTVVCTHNVDSAGSSNNANQTATIATEHGKNVKSFRSLDATLLTKRTIEI